MQNLGRNEAPKPKFNPPDHFVQLLSKVVLLWKCLCCGHWSPTYLKISFWPYLEGPRSFSAELHNPAHRRQNPFMGTMRLTSRFKGCLSTEAGAGDGAGVGTGQAMGRSGRAPAAAPSPAELSLPRGAETAHDAGAAGTANPGPRRSPAETSKYSRCEEHGPVNYYCYYYF